MYYIMVTYRCLLHQMAAQVHTIGLHKNTYTIMAIVSIRAGSVSVFGVGIGIRYFRRYFFHVGSVFGIGIGYRPRSSANRAHRREAGALCGTKN